MGAERHAQADAADTLPRRGVRLDRGSTVSVCDASPTPAAVHRITIVS